MYEKQLANKFFNAQVRAKRMNVTGDIMTRDSQVSAGYWEIVQDALADLVRIMLVRCFDEENHKLLYDHCRNLRGQVWLCAFPNLFITIAPAEWKFPKPYFLVPYTDCMFACAYIMSLHMYYIVRCMWMFLANRFGHRFFQVFEYVSKTEYQGRGTPHWHIAAWVVCFGLLHWLQGRTGTAVTGVFVRFLSMLFMCEIDVQIGNGRLNYINGYVSKDHDAVDVGLGEYVQKNSNSSWLAAYRLLSKGSPCLPEIAIRMAQLSEFERSYSHVLLYPPQPSAMIDYDGRQGNFTSKMYGFYLQEQRQVVSNGNRISECFLVWHRTRQYDSVQEQVQYRGGKHQQGRAPTLVVACRYWYELTDGYWGQFTLTQLPHLYAANLIPVHYHHLVSMQNFVGAIEYLCSWKWSSEVDVIHAAGDCSFRITALPLVVDDEGLIKRIGEYVSGEAVFASDKHAFVYLMLLAKRDVQYRGMRDDRISCFHWKLDASFLLYHRVRHCPDDIEYKCMRQSWDTLNRAKYSAMKWSGRQAEALQCIRDGVSHEDEELRAQSFRWLFIQGAPGSGKSAVLLEAAIEHSASMEVLIICPTGFQVHSFKARLPERDGIDNIRVDTIHGVLNYQRPGADKKVKWSPPSALRRIDLILMDEASQYEDAEWLRFFTCVKEQPHKPFVGVVADFQQLQPIVSGASCRAFCLQMQTIVLDTVYRSSDESHLLFLNRIRFKQPERPLLAEYFGDRHWNSESLAYYVQQGMRLAAEEGEPFTWLTTTNHGAALVCAAALEGIGVSTEELAAGYLCDPTTKSDLRILARRGIVLRLSRNFDKQRGFVNGALVVVCESLRGNAVFTAKLMGSGNMVLIHPMEEGGELFLPCCYGYATTIRRAQGADLYHGCIFFDQKKPAGRGYGYVGTSRFKSRTGCHVYGKLRRTDFLPVGGIEDDEVLDRGYESVSSDEDDGCGLQHAFPEEDCEYDFPEEVAGDRGNTLIAVDFE